MRESEGTVDSPIPFFKLLSHVLSQSVASWCFCPHNAKGKNNSFNIRLPFVVVRCRSV